MEVVKTLLNYDLLKDWLTSRVPSQEVLTSKPVVIATGVVAINLSAYAFFRYKFRYWKSKGLNGPDPSYPFGNMLHLMSKPFEIFNEWQQKYGSIYGIYLMYTPCLIVGDANMLKELLVSQTFLDRPIIQANVVVEESLINKNGIEWKHDRSIMSPSFTSGKMKLMYPLIENCYEKLQLELDKFCSSEIEFNPKDTFTKLTSMVIARCAFATEVNAFVEDDQHPLVKHLFTILTPDLGRFLIFIFTPSFLRKKFQLHATHPKSFNYITDLLKSIIKTRKVNQVSNEYNDLLQLLLDTQTDENGLSDDKIVANCFLFFMAGLETTAQTLTFISYCLALNPDVQEKLYEEVKSAVDSVGSLNYEMLFELKYLDAVINETLRLYPPAPQVARLCNSEYTLSNGIKLSPKSLIFIPIESIHKNEQYHPDPERFDPSRFLPENKNQIAPCTFIPFVAGPRNCIGMRFAMLEIKLTVAEMILSYRFVRGPNTPDKLTPKLFKIRTDGILIKMGKRT